MFRKNCPECGKEQIYTNKNNLLSAVKKNKICNKCSKNKNKKFGKDNPFYGKKHTEESKRKITENKDWSPYKTKEFKEKISKATKGNKNPMCGRTYFDVWVEKYGIEEANKRNDLKKERNSIASSGKRNGNYGKSPSNKVGAGWSGWYNGWFFRSLRELSYVVNVIEKNNYEWKSGELLRIPYQTWDGRDRTYSPDFIINNKIIVEIKPIKIQELKNIKEKTLAGQKYCEENGMEYLITDVEIICLDKLNQLLVDNKIKFTDKTLLKFNKYKVKHHAEINNTSVTTWWR